MDAHVPQCAEVAGVNGQSAPEQSVPSDQLAGWLLISAIGVEVFRVLLMQLAIITPETSDLIEIVGYAVFGAFLCVLAAQGAYYVRVRNKERRWRLQVAAVLALTGFGLYGSIILSKNLDGDFRRFVASEGPIGHEELIRLLERSNAHTARKADLSLSIARTAYIKSGELRLVLDAQENWVQFQPSKEEMEHRRLIVRLQNGSIRPTRQEVIAGLAFAACVIFLCFGYFRATQFSNRAPNASL